MDLPTITILMSTYNGELYIKEQLDSILNQKHVNIQLCVRDDGSSDNTLSILSGYKNIYPEKIDILNGENIGWKKSFFRLLQYASEHYNQSEYFSFADQDDIWLPYKLIKGIKALDTLNVGPNLYFSNLLYYKNGINYGKIRKQDIKLTVKRSLVRNDATGCTIVFNRDLLQLVGNNIPSIEVAHDYWMFQTAMLCGNVYYDNDSYILYRQHENNQIGHKTSKKDIWLRRIRNFSTMFRNHRTETQAKELRKLYFENMPINSQNAVQKLAEYRNSILGRLLLICDNGYTLGRLSNNFWMKTKALLGIL